MMALAAAAFVRMIASALFVESWLGLFFVLIFLVFFVLYTLAWRWMHSLSVRETMPGAVLLVLSLSGLAVLLAPGEILPPRWIPGDLREVPGVLGIFTFYIVLTMGSIRIVAGYLADRPIHDGPTPLEGRLGFFLPIPLFLAGSILEKAIRGNFGLLIIVSGILVAIFLGRRFSRAGPWAGKMTRFRRSLGNWMVLFREDDRAFAVLIGLFAFGLRLAFALGLNAADLDPRFLAGPDSGVYDQTAWLLAGGQAHILDPRLWLYNYNAGPSLFYFGIYKVVGHSPGTVRILQAALAALTIVLLFQMGVRWFGGSAARIGAFLIAGRGYLVGYGTYLGSETLGLLLVTLLIWTMRRLQEFSKEGKQKGLISRAGGAGVLLGALVLTRPEYRWFLIGGLIWHWCIVRPRKAWTLAAWVLGFLLIVLPMMARNHVSIGRFELNSPDTIKSQYGLRSLQKHVKSTPLKTMDPQFLKAFGRFAVRHPLTTLQALGSDLAYNFYTFWNWKRYVFNPAFVYWVRNERMIHFIGAFLTVMFLLGVWASRADANVLSPLYLLIGYKTLIHLLTENNEWWRFTVEPFVNLFQGFGLYVLARYIFNALAPSLSSNRTKPPP